MKNLLFDGSTSQPKNLEDAVFQALGAASVCWDDEGVFISDRASRIGQELLDYVDVLLDAGIKFISPDHITPAGARQLKAAFKGSSMCSCHE